MKKQVNNIFNFVYTRLFKINDTTQKVSLGFGLGVFAGILPGTGPIASLFLAFIFRANRASALLGSLLTNTWLSFVTFLLSIKTGSVIMGLNWQAVREEWSSLLRDFQWLNLLKASTFKIILPVFLGYMVIGICCGLLAYAVTFIIIKAIKYENKS